MYLYMQSKLIRLAFLAPGCGSGQTQCEVVSSSHFLPGIYQNMYMKVFALLNCMLLLNYEGISQHS